MVSSTKDLLKTIRLGIDDTPIPKKYSALPKWFRILIVIVALFSGSILFLYPGIRAVFIVISLVACLCFGFIYILKGKH